MLVFCPLTRSLRSLGSAPMASLFTRIETRLEKLRRRANRWVFSRSSEQIHLPILSLVFYKYKTLCCWFLYLTPRIAICSCLRGLEVVTSYLMQTWRHAVSVPLGRPRTLWWDHGCSSASFNIIDIVIIALTTPVFVITTSDHNANRRRWDWPVSGQTRWEDLQKPRSTTVSTYLSYEDSLSLITLIQYM